MFSEPLLNDARRLLEALRARGLKLATAESCTGGLIAALMTEIAGSSDVFERGFVTYSNAAKVGLLDVDLELIFRYGAVSAEVASAMAAGAVRASGADLAVAVTGVAGPGGGSAEKPVGLVLIGTCWRGADPRATAYRFGDIGRSEVRLATVREAVVLLLAESQGADTRRSSGAGIT
jgi:nicotinamide-nucleotide amidase